MKVINPKWATRRNWRGSGELSRLFCGLGTLSELQAARANLVAASLPRCGHLPSVTLRAFGCFGRAAAPTPCFPQSSEESGFWPGIEAREAVFGASVVDALLGITLGITCVERAARAAPPRHSAPFAGRPRAKVLALWSVAARLRAAQDCRSFGLSHRRG